jgi:hypothetical protein
VDVEDDFQAKEVRFILYRGGNAPIIAFSNEHGQFADRLGEIGDALVAKLPPVSPSKALEQLRAVAAPGEMVVDDRRRLTLAAVTSARACLSPNRLELYPKDMEPVEALKLASGTLAGLESIPVRELHQRVRDRYPDARLLPDRPLLDRYVEQAGLELVWDSAAVPDPSFPEVKGAYVRRRSGNISTASGFSMLGSSRGHGTRLSKSDEQQACDACSQRLKGARDARGFLVIQCEYDWATLGESALRSAFADLSVINLEVELITSMRAMAASVRIPWATALNADTAKPGTTDYDQLRRLVKESLKPLAVSLRSNKAPLLLVNPGLLARYDQISFLSDLRDAAGTPSGPPGLWVLVPVGSFGTHPTIDGAAVPIIGSHQTMNLHRAWIAHHSRAGAA